MRVSNDMCVKFKLFLILHFSMHILLIVLSASCNALLDIICCNVNATLTTMSHYLGQQL